MQLRGGTKAFSLMETPILNSISIFVRSSHPRSCSRT